MPFSLSVEAGEDIVSIAEQGVRTFGSLAAEQTGRRFDSFQE
jgi:toxin ParE1/3/4